MMTTNVSDILVAQKTMWNKYAPGWKIWDDLIMTGLRPMTNAMTEQVIGWSIGDDLTAILDVATGTGEPGMTIARLLPRAKVTGIDLAEEMVTIATEKARQSGVSNYSALVADAGKMPFADGTYDIILCRLGAMFFPDLPATIAEFRRVLKAGGRLVLTAWAGAEHNSWATLASAAVAAHIPMQAPVPGAPSMFRLAAPGLITELLSSSGFTNAEQKLVSGTLNWNDPLHYWSCIQAVSAPIVNALSSADAATQKLVTEQVLNESRSFMNDGLLSLEWSAWMVSAVVA